MARMKESSQDAPRRIVIGCRNAAELRLLLPALERLRSAQPEVLPVLRLIPFDSMENLLEDGTIQLMFSFQSTAMTKARYVELCYCPIVCVCARTHPLASYESITIEQLRSSGRIAVCRPPICPPDLFAIQTQAVGGRATSQILFCDNQEAIFPLVAAGYGFALVPDYPHTRMPELRYLSISQVEPLSFGAVYFPQKTGSIIRQFLELLKTCAQEDQAAGKQAQD